MQLMAGTSGLAVVQLAYFTLAYYKDFQLLAAPFVHHANRWSLKTA